MSNKTTRAAGTPPITLLDIDGVAAALGVSPKTVRRMTRARLLPHLRVGRQIRFRAVDIATWQAAQLVPALREVR